MSEERRQHSTLTLQQAVVELEHLIQAHYPGTVFAVGSGGDDPDGTYITATVDLEDPDEVLDLVIERLLWLQVEERLPVYIIPIRAPERVAELRRQQHRGQRVIAPHAPLHS